MRRDIGCECYQRVESILSRHRDAGGCHRPREETNWSSRTNCEVRGDHARKLECRGDRMGERSTCACHCEEVSPSDTSVAEDSGHSRTYNIVWSYCITSETSSGNVSKADRSRKTVH